MVPTCYGYRAKTEHVKCQCLSTKHHININLTVLILTAFSNQLIIFKCLVMRNRSWKRSTFFISSVLFTWILGVSNAPPFDYCIVKKIQHRTLIVIVTSRKCKINPPKSHAKNTNGQKVAKCFISSVIGIREPNWNGPWGMNVKVA